MKIIKQSLTPEYIKYGIDGCSLLPVLTCMIHDSQPERSFPAVIIVPGGSYSRCSKREGEPTAARFYSYGYNTFVLEYSVINKQFPTSLLELCAAVRFVKENKDDLCCTDEVAVCGFSAGGHLTASLGAFYNEFGGSELRPDKMILCYPVITSGRFTHTESVNNIAPTDELKDKISLEKHIHSEFPPTFIWHCADDKVVPVENSLMLAAKLSSNKIPFEMHIFPSGGHGKALCDITTMKDNDPSYINPVAAQWVDLALEWLKK